MWCACACACACGAHVRQVRAVRMQGASSVHTRVRARHACGSTGSMPAASSSSSVASSLVILAPRPSSMRTDHGACRWWRGLAAARRCGCSAAVACSRPSSCSAQRGIDGDRRGASVLMTRRHTSMHVSSWRQRSVRAPSPRSLSRPRCRRQDVGLVHDRVGPGRVHRARLGDGCQGRAGRGALLARQGHLHPHGVSPLRKRHACA